MDGVTFEDIEAQGVRGVAGCAAGRAPHQTVPARVKTAMVVVMLWEFGAAWSPAQAIGQCCGDCNGDGAVTVEEIITGVNRAHGSCADDGICSMGSCAAQLATCRDDLAAYQCDAGAVPTSEEDRVREVFQNTILG